jgi:hypothetical protein
MWLWTSPWSCIPHPPWFLLPLTVSKRYLPWLFWLHRVGAPAAYKLFVVTNLKV